MMCMLPERRCASTDSSQQHCVHVTLFTAQDEEHGKYRLAKQGVEFSRYMREEGWHIIPIKASDQLVRPGDAPRVAGSEE